MNDICGILFQDFNRRPGHEIGHGLVDTLVTGNDGEDDDERVGVGHVVDVRDGRIVQQLRVRVKTWKTKTLVVFLHTNVLFVFLHFIHGQFYNQTS